MTCEIAPIERKDHDRIARPDRNYLVVVRETIDFKNAQALSPFNLPKVSYEFQVRRIQWIISSTLKLVCRDFQWLIDIADTNLFIYEFIFGNLHTNFSSVWFRSVHDSRWFESHMLLCTYRSACSGTFCLAKLVSCIK